METERLASPWIRAMEPRACRERSLLKAQDTCCCWWTRSAAPEHIPRSGRASLSGGGRGREGGEVLLSARCSNHICGQTEALVRETGSGQSQKSGQKEAEGG
uniref:Uncharacterized protein n=1 Tax=Knipowitschia caucasica TaxID=637954 RepID=A0AAV2KJ93_KNICA